MEILCKEEIEFSYALRFVCTTPFSKLFWVLNSYVPSYANSYWEQSMEMCSSTSHNVQYQQCTLSLRIITSAPPTAVDTPATNTGGEGEEAARSLLLTVCGRLESRALRVLDPLSLSSLPSLSFPPTYYDTTTSRFCLWQSNTRECNTFLASESVQFNISGVVYACPSH